MINPLEAVPTVLNFNTSSNIPPYKWYMDTAWCWRKWEYFHKLPISFSTLSLFTYILKIFWVLTLCCMAMCSNCKIFTGHMVSMVLIATLVFVAWIFEGVLKFKLLVLLQGGLSSKWHYVSNAARMVLNKKVRILRHWMLIFEVSWLVKMYLRSCACHVMDTVW